MHSLQLKRQPQVRLDAAAAATRSQSGGVRASTHMHETSSPSPRPVDEADYELPEWQSSASRSPTQTLTAGTPHTVLREQQQQRQRAELMDLRTENQMLRERLDTLTTPPHSLHSILTQLRHAYRQAVLERDAAQDALLLEKERRYELERHVATLESVASGGNAAKGLASSRGSSGSIAAAAHVKRSSSSNSSSAVHVAAQKQHALPHGKQQASVSVSAASQGGRSSSVLPTRRSRTREGGRSPSPSDAKVPPPRPVLSAPKSSTQATAREELPMQRQQLVEDPYRHHSYSPTTTVITPTRSLFVDPTSSPRDAQNNASHGQQRVWTHQSERIGSNGYPDPDQHYSIYSEGAGDAQLPGQQQSYSLEDVQALVARSQQLRAAVESRQSTVASSHNNKSMLSLL